jgi:hypothetical protein
MGYTIYESGTGTERSGVNSFNVSVGDTISIDVFLLNPRQEAVTGVETYFTVNDEYFDLVTYGPNDVDDLKPFVKGPFLPGDEGSILPYGNSTHGDTLSANDNEFEGWQLDYVDLTVHDGTTRPFTTVSYGVASTFKLIAKAPCDSVQITLDDDVYYGRDSRYHKLNASDSYSFKIFNSCYISVTGMLIDPELPDILMEPGSTNSSIDLDGHISFASEPVSDLLWTAAGNANISVNINPQSHIVTFTSPENYKGFENITFTVKTSDGSIVRSDTMKVTVGSAPAFLENALPDTIYVYEDSLQVVLNLPDIVEDKDSPFASLNWQFTTGPNVTVSQSDTSLVLMGKQDFNGADYLDIKVWDELGSEDMTTLPVWVYSVNDPPVFSGLPDITFERTKGYILDMSDYASDADLDLLSLNYNTPENFIININGMSVTINEKTGFLGSEELIFMVSDPAGITAADTLKAEVTPLTGLPVWSSLPKIGFAQNTSHTDLILWDYVSDPDGETSELTFEFSGNDDVDSTFVSTQNGRMYLYDLDNTPGWDLITVTATDLDNNKASTQFLAFIGPADGTPIMADIPDTTIRAGAVSEWIDLDNYYYDVDHADNQMTWTWEHSGNDSLVIAEINDLFRQVTLKTIYPDSTGTDRLLFTVTDPDGKFADDESLIKILAESMPVLDMPSKIGFVTGVGTTIDLDDYAVDPDFDTSELVWSWNGNVNISIEVDTEDSTSVNPVKLSTAGGWTGWEKVYFSIQNPLGGSAIDSTIVYSVPSDGSPVVGGLGDISIKAGLCDSLNIDLDDYYYDSDTADGFMTWSVTGGDSVTVTINPVTHEVSFCAPSSTYEGQQVIAITVSDGVNSDSMVVVVNVYGAYIGDVFSMMLFRNPMQGDFMDIYIASNRGLQGAPSLSVMVVGDTTSVSMSSVSEDTLNYYHGHYLLPYDASLGLQQDAVILANGTTSGGKTVQDTLGFAYGRFGMSGGKISLGSMSVEVPEEALTEIEMLTLTSLREENGAAGKIASQEILFKGDIYTLGPSNLTSRIPMDVAFSVCCRADGAGVYRLEQDGWKFAGGALSDNMLKAQISSGGKYRVGFDRISPQIELVGSGDGVVTFSAEDFGSGIDISSIRIAYDGSDLAFKYDAEKSIVNVDLSEIYGEIDIMLDVFVSDRSGNETSEFLGTRVKPVPGQFFVEQNAPNPFNPTTTITFINTSGQKVSIEIFDILGRKVRVLTDDFYSAGTHNIVWNARDESGRTVSNGTYIYTVVSGKHAITRKMLFLK